MTKDEMIKGLRYKAENIKAHMEPEFFAEVADYLEEQKWIPVSERLPEKSMKCLVAVGRFNFTEIATYSDLMGIIERQIFYQGEVGHDSFEDITQYVKAWMPLPYPYIESEVE